MNFSHALPRCPYPYPWSQVVHENLSLWPTNVGKLPAARCAARIFLCGSFVARTGRALRALATHVPYGTPAAHSLVSG